MQTLLWYSIHKLKTQFVPLGLGTDLHSFKKLIRSFNHHRDCFLQFLPLEDSAIGVFFLVLGKFGLAILFQVSL
jgi:hypothetical protein